VTQLARPHVEVLEAHDVRDAVAERRAANLAAERLIEELQVVIEAHMLCYTDALGLLKHRRKFRQVLHQYELSHFGSPDRMRSWRGRPRGSAPGGRL